MDTSRRLVLSRTDHGAQGRADGARRRRGDAVVFRVEGGNARLCTHLTSTWPERSPSLRTSATRPGTDVIRTAKVSAAARRDRLRRHRRPRHAT